MDKIEFLVLKNLLNNEEYLRKTIPFIRKNIFKIAIKRLSLKKFLRLLGSIMKLLQKKFLLLKLKRGKI